MRPWIGALLATLLLTGCASERVATLVQEKPSGLQNAARISDVAFRDQQTYLCGPAVMGMALEHAGIETNTDTLAPELFIPERRGSLQIEMMATPRRHGAIAYQIEPELEALLQEIAAGHPVIVLQNLSLAIAPQWHYALAIGYDLAEQRIILHSGDIPNYSLDLSTFERTWQRAGGWAMLALPAGELPATAEAGRYLKAAAVLETRGDNTGAEHAYQAATVYWPENLAARMGLGNALYAKGDLEGAASAFKQAIAQHPESGAAYNNLAQVYMMQERFDLALNAVQTAITKDGESPIYHQTWQEIVDTEAASHEQTAEAPRP